MASHAIILLVKKKSSKRTLKKTLEPSLRSFSFSLHLNLLLPRLLILSLLSPSSSPTYLILRLCYWSWPSEVGDYKRCNF
ncbi:hypothetical protein Patl1_01928 [Pistacia atlantica]|uniref:Uncharacterized protein n=1 Tax=Pistacia atlantica TaxID=434234 RepID=A0ACC1C766_9ROSI|nr:hypothetical protein Patl1_01928 [Pistacia atlantica]